MYVYVSVYIRAVHIKMKDNNTDPSTPSFLYLSLFIRADKKREGEREACLRRRERERDGGV